MKHKKIAIIAIALAVGVAVGALGFYGILELSGKTIVSRTIVPSDAENGGKTQSANQSGLMELAVRAARFIKMRDFKSLSEMAHPTFGVYFCPGATVNLRNNKVFTQYEVSNFRDDENSYVWGVSTNTGVPIEMTAEEYFSRYVYDKDYANAPIIGVNYAARTGNSLENLSEAFPNAKFVDLCFPGTEANEYHDWGLLRLCFEEYKGMQRLTAVIHSEYTV